MIPTTPRTSGTDQKIKIQKINDFRHYGKETESKAIKIPKNLETVSDITFLAVKESQSPFRHLLFISITS